MVSFFLTWVRYETVVTPRRVLALLCHCRISFSKLFFYASFFHLYKSTQKLSESVSNYFCGMEAEFLARMPLLPDENETVSAWETNSGHSQSEKKKVVFLSSILLTDNPQLRSLKLVGVQRACGIFALLASVQNNSKIDFSEAELIESRWRLHFCSGIGAGNTVMALYCAQTQTRLTNWRPC